MGSFHLVAHFEKCSPSVVVSYYSQPNNLGFVLLRTMERYSERILKNVHQVLLVVTPNNKQNPCQQPINQWIQFHSLNFHCSIALSVSLKWVLDSNLVLSSVLPLLSHVTQLADILFLHFLCWFFFGGVQNDTTSGTTRCRENDSVVSSGRQIGSSLGGAIVLPSHILVFAAWNFSIELT